MLDNVVIHGVKAKKGKFSSKEVEVLISTNGRDFSFVAGGELPRKGKYSITLDMNSVQAAYVKLVIKSGYNQKYWQLAEFVVNGTFADTNLPPMANAGPDQTTSPEITVFLDGSQSSDPEGDPLAYSWSLTAPNSSNASLSDVSLVNPSFKVDVPGEYEAELIVNDGFSDSAPDQVLISTYNTPPVADAGPDQAASINQLIQLDGSDSSDVDGDLLDFSWSLTVPEGSSATLSNADSVYTDFMVDVPGDYEAELVVNDGNMNGNSEPDSVLITTENTPPVVDAGLDQVAVIGETIQLDGSGSGDVDGDSLNYFWSLPWCQMVAVRFCPMSRKLIPALLLISAVPMSLKSLLMTVSWKALGTRRLSAPKISARLPIRDWIRLQMLATPFNWTAVAHLTLMAILSATSGH